MVPKGLIELYWSNSQKNLKFVKTNNLTEMIITFFTHFVFKVFLLKKRFPSPNSDPFGCFLIMWVGFTRVISIFEAKSTVFFLRKNARLLQ